MMLSKQAWRPRRGAAFAACALAAALAFPPADAADPPQKKPSSKTATKGKTNLMTRDELRACMDEQDRLKKLSDGINQGQAALDRQRGEVQALDAELAGKRAALDPADAAGKQALEAEVARRDQIVDSYNARLAEVRQQATSFDTGRQGWVERCTNKDYDEMDEAAIKLERKRAAAAKK